MILHFWRVTLLAVLVLPAGSCAKKTSATIKLGEYASLTGKEAAYGQPSHKGTVLAIEEINAAGGVLGQPIELICEDDQSKPGEAATSVSKLIFRDQVVAVLGEAISSRSLEGALICQQHHLPMVSPSSTNPAVTATGDCIFRVCFIDPFQGVVLARFARETLKARRVAVLSSASSAYSVGLTRFFKERFTAGGGEIALEQEYSEGDKDFKAELTAIKAAGVDAVFVPGYYNEDALIARQARELGLTVPLFGGDGWDAPQLLELGGTAVEGVYFSTHYSSGNTASAVREFVKKFRARWDGETPDALAALGYDSAGVLADAIRRAGSTDAARIRDALAATRDFHGVTGTTTIDASRNATKTAVIITVKDGRFQFVATIAP